MNAMEQPPEMIQVEVVYALPEKQMLIELTVPKVTTVQQAIEQSKILTHFPEIDLNRNKVGIFSKLCSLDTRLRAGDRIEIYRSLIADPKAIRQKRAVHSQKKST